MIKSIAIAVLVLGLVGCAAKPETESKPEPNPITYLYEGIVRREGKSVTLTVWVKAVPSKDRPGFYEAVEWSTRDQKFEGCDEVDGDEYHFKTWYPMALLPGPNGEGAVIMKFEPAVPPKPKDDSP